MGRADSDSLDVFSYQDFRTFLKDFYKKRRATDRRFSIRFFAKRAGLTSENYLKVVMDGRRSLTARNLPKFIKGLGLDRPQADYFEALVHLNQARDVTEKRQFLDRILHLQKKKAALILNPEQLEFFTNWYHIVIFEMACQAGFNANAEVISQRLQRKITSQQAAESLELMFKTGILKWREDETLEPIAPQLAFSDDTSTEIYKEQTKKLHDTFIKLGLEALYLQGPDTREVKGLTIGLTKEQIPLFKQKMAEFQRELSTTFSTGLGEDIYQLNLQFFKLTKSGDEA